MIALIYTTHILHAILQIQAALRALDTDLRKYTLTWPEGYTFKNGRLYDFQFKEPGNKARGEEQCFTHGRSKVWNIQQEDELNWIFHEEVTKTAIWIPYIINKKYNVMMDSQGNSIISSTLMKENIQWTGPKPVTITECMILTRVDNTTFQLSKEDCTSTHHTVCLKHTRRKYAITYGTEVEQTKNNTQIQVQTLLSKLQDKEKEVRKFKADTPLRKMGEQLNEIPEYRYTHNRTMDLTLKKQMDELNKVMSQIQQKLTGNIDVALVLAYSNILTLRMNSFLHRITQILKNPQDILEKGEQYQYYHIYNNNLAENSLEWFISYTNETKGEEEGTVNSFYEVTLIDVLLAVVSTIALVITLMKFFHIYQQKNKKGKTQRIEINQISTRLPSKWWKRFKGSGKTSAMYSLTPTETPGIPCPCKNNTCTYIPTPRPNRTPYSEKPLPAERRDSDSDTSSEDENKVSTRQGFSKTKHVRMATEAQIYFD